MRPDMGGGKMKMKLKMKRFFNLIEVSLAMGVTAVGILGAVTILPIALKTTSSTTYSAYLSDASNMIFAGIDNFLNEECYLHRYQDEHRSDVTAQELQEIDEARSEKFRNIFAVENNDKAANNLNAGLEIPHDITSSKSDRTGVHVVLVKAENDNHGLIAFYSSNPPSSSAIELPKTDPASPINPYELPMDPDKDKVGHPVFAARYRIVVTDLEDDNNFKMDGLRQLVEVQTEKITFHTTGRDGQDLKPIDLPGIRVPGTRRFMNFAGLKSEEQSRRREKNQLMKRVYIEFSWPYRTNYERRNKKTFIKEYYYTSN